MESITVFTPTYNRLSTLKRTYKSLLNQTCLDFRWIVVDDGSTDNTCETVNTWIKQSPFQIQYFYKENGGLHTGYNTAIAHIDTELCICCDSDDYLPKNAIELILKTWKEKGNNNIAGIIGLDFIHNKNIPIGGYFKDTTRTYHFLELTPLLGHKGDVKMVHRTELLRPHIPMLTLNNEKNFNPIYLFLKINPSLKYILLNENLCNVEYQDTGMSANIFNQYKNSPYSFAELRKVRLAHPLIKLSRKYIDAAHLVSSAFLAKDISILRNAPKRWLCALSVPLGFAIYFLILYKTHKFSK